ncbi:enoyl-CoA hydratase/isomerase family protein [Cognatishimia sp. SS12]|uniref:enoyl-CoA hydratase/isomerase family protein n=1 Tax=Cognatishimia sp. SS12 TaxID=2979465 RepID=UPI002330F6D3|nr:enoyl-CoA hydratase/isomerase family protein [Cognatishimia sp. SS12]MDC0737478.1 enoyl-CoA hydratase/isomerase family protein [Cognatishimia sp. SS12]
MSDIQTRKIGVAGRITFRRPKALNALSHEMALQIETALDAWRDDPEVQLILIDAEGDKAFCAGGDIAALYHSGRAGDYEVGRQFWRDEYRMNAKIADYPKPIVSLMQGFTMGGGVGVGCHGSHRIVGESSQISMPETGIGLIPDVGGSLLLARAPGQLGPYLGLTAGRLNAADAILSGFADSFVPEEAWPDLIAQLEATGDLGVIAEMAQEPGTGPLGANAAQIDALFAGETLAEITAALRADDTEVAAKALKALMRNSPLSMVATLELIKRARESGDIRDALRAEYRFTHRAMADSDFLEGVRAAVIDKDRSPQWSETLDAPNTAAALALLAPLGADELTF